MIGRFFRWQLFGVVAAGCLSVPCGLAEQSQQSDLDREIARLLADSIWDYSSEARLSGGYRRNPLLRPAGGEGTPFAKAAIDAFLWTPPTGKYDGRLLVAAEETRFTDAEGSDGERLGLVRLEGRARFAEGWLASLTSQAFHQEQVFDLSELDTERLPTKLTARGASVAPAVRWSGGIGWVEVGARGQRDRYRGGMDNTADRGLALRAGRRLGWLELELSLRDDRRRFDTWNQRTIGGRVLPGTRLEFDDLIGEARAKFRFVANGRWSGGVRYTRLERRDNGSGWYDYDQDRIIPELEWQSGSWTIGAELSAARATYRVQRVGFGDPPPRRRDDETILLRVERRLGPRWSIFGSGEWDRSRTNEEQAGYRAWTTLFGVARTLR
jgi:hypothetical protein